MTAEGDRPETTAEDYRKPGDLLPRHQFVVREVYLSMLGLGTRVELLKLGVCAARHATPRHATPHPTPRYTPRHATHHAALHATLPCPDQIYNRLSQGRSEDGEGTCTNGGKERNEKGNKVDDTSGGVMWSSVVVDQQLMAEPTEGSDYPHPVSPPCTQWSTLGRHVLVDYVGRCVIMCVHVISHDKRMTFY